MWYVTPAILCAAIKQFYLNCFHLQSVLQNIVLYLMPCSHSDGLVQERRNSGALAME